LIVYAAIGGMLERVKNKFMNTMIQKINSNHFEEKELKEACQILQKGGLVAFPTETVYGLGGNALSPEASQKIYQAKGRPSDNPLIVHIADFNSLYDVADKISEKALALAEAYWPGPLTMIFAKKQKIPFSTTGGLDTVAVRMPSHPIALALIRLSGIYIAAPSANTSGRPSPTRAEHVIEDLNGKIEAILDGGTVGIGIESTIIDMATDTPTILRPGFVTKAMAEKIIGKVSIDPAITTVTPQKNTIAKAPGMKYRHYAPKGKMTIVEGSPSTVIQKINELAAEKEADQKKTAVIATEESKEKYRCRHVYSIGSLKNEGSIAAGLYDILREMDHIGAEYIFAESFSQDTLGQAIMNRMLKAAGYRRVKV